jgi:hypothetical protein
MNSELGMVNRTKRRLHPRWRERYLPDARAGGVEDRVGDGGGNVAAGGFSCAVRGKFRVIQEDDFHLGRDVRGPRDRIRFANPRWSRCQAR